MNFPGFLKWRVTFQELATEKDYILSSFLQTLPLTAKRRMQIFCSFCVVSSGGGWRYSFFSFPSTVSFSSPFWSTSTKFYKHIYIFALTRAPILFISIYFFHLFSLLGSIYLFCQRAEQPMIPLWSFSCLVSESVVQHTELQSDLHVCIPDYLHIGQLIGEYAVVKKT